MSKVKLILPIMILFLIIGSASFNNFNLKPVNLYCHLFHPLPVQFSPFIFKTL